MASTSNLGKTQGPVLVGKNYEFWSLRMKTFLQVQECWEPVENGFSEPDQATLQAMTNGQRNQLAELRKKENKAKFWIQSSVDDSIFPKITRASSAKQAWDILELAYQGNDKVKTVKLQTLRREFETLKMKEEENIDQFMTRVMGVVNQLRIHGEKIEDQKIVEKVLRSLPKKFEMVVISIEESKDLSKLTVKELMGSLLSHESRINMEEESLEHAFKTQAFIGRGRGREKEVKVKEVEVVIKQKEEQHQNNQNNQINLNTLRIRGGEVKDGQTNLKSNVTTAKNMVTMKVNAERNNQI
jgi:hypothetical protein